MLLNAIPWSARLILGVATYIAGSCVRLVVCPWEGFSRCGVNEITENTLLIMKLSELYNLGHDLIKIWREWCTQERQHLNLLQIINWWTCATDYCVTKTMLCITGPLWTESIGGLSSQKNGAVKSISIAWCHHICIHIYFLSCFLHIFQSHKI